MSKETTKKVIVTCDRCKKEWDYSKHNLNTLSTIKYSYEAKAYTGDWGGATRDYDLCDDCTVSFEQFMSNRMGEK